MLAVISPVNETDKQTTIKLLVLKDLTWEEKFAQLLDSIKPHLWAYNPIITVQELKYKRFLYGLNKSLCGKIWRSDIKMIARTQGKKHTFDVVIDEKEAPKHLVEVIQQKSIRGL